MNQKGEIESRVFVYILIVLFMAMLFLFSYNGILKLLDTACKTEIAGFKRDITGLASPLDFGDVKEFKKKLPCGSRKLIFVDKNESITPHHIADPILRDNILGESESSLFLFKDDSLVFSAKADSYEIPYPYYECLYSRNNRVNFFLEGGDDKALLTPGCNQEVCTRIPINITLADARDILKEFADLPSCEACPKLSDLPEFDKHVRSFYLLASKAKLYRRFRYCPKTKLTTVEIIIVPNKGEKLEDVAYYEFIPKGCVEELKPILERIFGEDTGVYVTVKDDPLIMWHFNEIKKETIIGYEIEQKLTDECRKALEGLGVMDICEEKGGCKYPPCKNALDCGVDGFSSEPYCFLIKDPSKLYRDFTQHKCSARGGCEAFIAPREIQDCGEDYCEPAVNLCRGNSLISSQTCHQRGCRADACFDDPYTQEGIIENCAFGCSGGSCNPAPAPTGGGGTGDAGEGTVTNGGITDDTAKAGGTSDGSTTDGTNPDGATNPDSSTIGGTPDEPTTPPPDPTGCEYNNPPCPGGYECIGNICFLQIGEGEGDTEDRGGDDGNDGGSGGSETGLD
jgi:hypothetical protein